jgi:hypothetical protein
MTNRTINAPVRPRATAEEALDRVEEETGGGVKEVVFTVVGMRGPPGSSRCTD